MFRHHKKGKVPTSLTPSASESLITFGLPITYYLTRHLSPKEHSELVSDLLFPMRPRLLSRILGLVYVRTVPSL